MKNVIGLLPLVLVGVLSCQTYNVSYVEGVKPLDQSVFSPLIKELIEKLPSLPEAEADQLMRTWQTWLGSRPVPMVDKDQVTFVYYAFEKGGPDKVALSASFNQFASEDFLFRLGKTKLFYKSFLVDKANRDLSYYYRSWIGKDFKNMTDPFSNDIEIARPVRNRLVPPDLATGHLELLAQVAPPANFQISKRDVYVYLPPGYNTQGGKTYPVLYLADGQNLWTGDKLPYGGWKVDQAADNLIRDGQIEPLIIVGIANSGLRKEEYVGASGYYNLDGTGKADLIARAKKISAEYQTYVLDTIKPLIEARYRIKAGRDNTGIGGSSFGAGISLLMAFSQPEVFGKVAALSAGNYSPGNALWDDRPFNMYPYLIQNWVSHKVSTKIWLDCGTKDTDEIFLPKMKALSQALVDAGFVEGKELWTKVYQGAAHNEAAWAARFPEVLKTLFPPPKS